MLIVRDRNGLVTDPADRNFDPAAFPATTHHRLRVKRAGDGAIVEGRNGPEAAGSYELDNVDRLEDLAVLYAYADGYQPDPEDFGGGIGQRVESRELADGWIEVDYYQDLGEYTPQ